MSQYKKGYLVALTGNLHNENSLIKIINHFLNDFQMKKLFNFKMAGSVLLMLAISFASCKQDSTVQPKPSVEDIQKESNEKVESLNLEGVDVQNGLLTFESNESMAEVREKLSKTNFISYEAWCIAKGFKSLSILKNEAFSAIENMHSRNEIEGFVKKNEDIIDIQNDKIHFKNDNVALLQFLNRESMFKIGAVLYRYDNKGEIIVTDGDLVKMKQAIADRKEHKEVKVYSNNFLQVRAYCTTADPNFTSTETGWTDGDNGRRANVFFRLRKEIQVATYQTSNVVVTLNVETQASKRTFGFWSNYTTEQTLNMNAPYGMQTEVMSPYPFAWGIPPSLTDITYFKSTIARDVGFTRTIFTLNGINDGQLNRDATIRMNHVDCTYSNRGGVNITFTCS